LSVFRHPHADPDRSALRELAYSLAGGALPEAWWRESHERILDLARALTWPARLVDLETQACQIVGDEFYDRFRSPGTGLHPVQWLRALAEETGAALRAALAEGADDWQKLWALLCGLALTAPRTPADPVDETAGEKFPEFPDIEFPLETALAEAEKSAALAVDREVEPGLGRLADGCRPAGEALVARDVYGSRRVLVAPFGYGGGAPDHWYAWDIDLCWIDVVVGAGVFGSAEDALSEWRDAVGAAASGAALSPCPAEMTAELLAPCLRTGPLADMLQGNEPRDLIREHYRLRRRARDLTGPAYAAGSSSFDAGRAPDAFADWYAARHDVPGEVTETASTIYDMWGPHAYPDERSFYACSPHRIEMAAHLIRESYFADHANPALRLLPEWTEWCIERTGLDGDAAARSRAAARSAATALVHDEDDKRAAQDDKAPFRRQE
ncbi:MAG TPA: hypothetical protein VEH31_43420, partial [Streptosporangiaceae bacterium]|nr:hypothetical protein [Streptosporangiaceae bacterium]